MAAFWDLQSCFKEITHETWGQRTLTCQGFPGPQRKQNQEPL